MLSPNTTIAEILQLAQRLEKHNGPLQGIILAPKGPARVFYQWRTLSFTLGEPLPVPSTSIPANPVVP